MKKLARAFLLPAVLLAHTPAFAAESSPPTQQVRFSMTVMDGGKWVMTRDVVGQTNAGLTWQEATNEADATACKFHNKMADTSFESHLKLGDSLTVMLFPIAVEDGRVDALISATVGHGEKSGTATVGGCVFAKGVAHEDSITDEAALTIGESKAIDLGAGKTLVIKREKI
ncbi:hypothetical protein [Paraburkholderia youngii]|uniref:hypothetical protein n=1 Tax=Paraburkholderia youngii TaxID=2782701 RepID=UPI003D1B68C0